MRPIMDVPADYVVVSGKRELPVQSRTDREIQQTVRARGAMRSVMGNLRPTVWTYVRPQTRNGMTSRLEKTC
jgi:hypothetical protein